MKFIFSIILTACIITVFSQNTDSIEIPSNSFEKEFNKLKPSLIYFYDSISQTHNYSNNWDFDKDGIKDELYFVGTCGAHLYYYLKVVLSTDKKSRDFKFIQSDFPFLTATDTLTLEKTIIGFTVAELGKDLITSIIIKLDDNTYYANKKKLAEHNLKTSYISISFENGKTKYCCP